MDLTFALRTFVRIVERGSLTAAARDLGISQPAVSKLLRNLEDHAGSRLLERSSRTLRPTDEGLRLYHASGGALQAIDAAIENVRSERGTISGRLRIHSPACIGERHLARIAMEFQDSYPNVSIELALENNPVDLIHENFDLAIRMGQPSQQDMIVTAIGMSTRVLVATPGFLSRRPPIESTKDLSLVELIVTDASLSKGTLSLTCDGRTEEISAIPKFSTNSAQVLLDAVRSGRGVGTSQLLLVSDDLKAGTMERVLPRHTIAPTPLFLVYPSSKHLRILVRMFLDFALPALRRIEGITSI
jgi:DNA-binding transcriptional LysR family regulator